MSKSRKHQSRKQQSKSRKSATRAAIIEQGVSTQDRLQALNDGVQRVAELREQFQNLPLPNRAGLIAEELHAMKFNANAAAARVNLSAQKGPTHAAHDLSIYKGADEVARVQLKYNGRVASTTKEIASVKYDGMQRVVPADQAEQVRSLASRRGHDHLGNRNYEATAQDSADVIRYEGIESEAVTLEEAYDWASDPTERLNQLSAAELTEAARSGAKAGAYMGGGLATLSAGYEVYKGEINLEEAAERIVVETVQGAARGAAVNAGGALIKQGLARAGAKRLAGSSAPVMIASGVLEVSGDVYRFAQGELSGEELAEATVKTAARTASTWAGAEAGAALGSCILPGVGTVIGGLLGGVLGGSLF